jgi:hypothetical protein
VSNDLSIEIDYFFILYHKCGVLCDDLAEYMVDNG